MSLDDAILKDLKARGDELRQYKETALDVLRARITELEDIVARQDKEIEQLRQERYETTTQNR